MTDQERARQLYECTAINTSGGRDWEETAISRIEVALQAVRREVWKEVLDRLEFRALECKQLSEQHGHEGVYTQSRAWHGAWCECDRLIGEFRVKAKEAR